jgi:Co/Zn/Cd efflux system component
VRGAFLEVFSDMLGSVGVIVAGVVLLTTGWPYADPIIGAGIGLFILPRAWRLGRDALRILLEMAPPGVDVVVVDGELAALPVTHVTLQCEPADAGLEECAVCATTGARSSAEREPTRGPA